MVPLLLAIAVAAEPPTPQAAPVPAVATSPAVPGKPVTAQKTDDPDKVICKTIVATGTRFPSKDCRRRSEWDQLSADSRRATTETVDRQAVMFQH